MPKFVDLTGKRFGALTVIERAETKWTKTRWLSKCDCGKYTITTAHRLLAGDTRSCGCLMHNGSPNEPPKYVGYSRRTHGMSKTRIYKTWSGMKKRCCNKNDKSYSRYGAKGISVCDEWMHDFMSFYNWSIENGYADGLSIDRIDNSKGYSPENCRWITLQEQARNKTTNVILEHDGESKLLSDWCKEFNIPIGIASQRYRSSKRAGNEISFDDIFFHGNLCSKRLAQYTKDGQLIKVWNQINDAVSAGYSRSGIYRCLCGKFKTSHGYIWKYADQDSSSL